MTSTTSNAIDSLSPVQRAYDYARAVLEDRIIACEKVKAACSRFFHDLERSKSPEYPWRFDERLANRPCEFIERFLTPTKGDYSSMRLMGWQCFCECNMYGWVDKKTGLRRFREVLILVGTGNGKSTLLAGNATYGACKDHERGADIYLLANSKDQAGIVFNECVGQIRASKYLSPRFRTLRDGVYYDKEQSTIKHRSSDSKRLDGLNPHMAIFDEIHEYRDFKLINIIKRKIVKRTQPMIVYITTMGNVIDGPLAYFYDLFTDAINEKLKQDVGDRMFGYIAELDPDDDVNDSRSWIKANPSIGHLLKQSELEAQWERDCVVPQQRADFICKQLNIMVQADDQAFVQPEVIKRNNQVIPMDALIGRRCYGGFDLSNREDFTAAALEFPLDDGRIFVLLHSWVPRRKVDMDAEKIDYYGLAMRGYLTIVESEYIDQEDVYRWFCEMAKSYEIVTIGYDPANATRLRQMMENYGFDMQVVRQGPLTLNDPMKDIKEQLLAGNIVTNNDPMFNWYLDNVRISAERRHTDKENWMPTKRNKYRKIDGFMAFLDAHCINLDKNPIGADADVEVRVIDVSQRRQTQWFAGRH